MAIFPFKFSPTPIQIFPKVNFCKRKTPFYALFGAPGFLPITGGFSASWAFLPGYLTNMQV